MVMLLKQKLIMMQYQILLTHQIAKIDAFVCRFSSRGAVTGTKVASHYVSFYLLLLLEIYVTFRLTRVRVSIFRFTTTGLRSHYLCRIVAHVHTPT